MRTPVLCSLLASSALLGACGAAGPKTPQELGDKVVAALVAKDWSAVKSLFWKVDDARSTCTDVPADKKEGIANEFAESLADAEKDFAKCGELGDWTGAKIVELKGGEVGKGADGCGDKAKEVDTIKLKVDLGGKVRAVRIVGPMLVGDQYLLLEGIRCKAAEVSCDDVYDHMAELVKAAPDARDMEKEMFSGAADKKTQFQTMCAEMKANASLAPILDCVVAAKTYADTKACEEKGEKGDAKAPEPAAAMPAVADAPAAPTAAPADANEACDKYFAKFKACTDGMPEAQRDMMKKGLDTIKSTLDGRSADEKTMACNAALSASKQAMSQLCPSVVWE